MRAVVTFEIHGKNHAELADMVLMRYRQYVGNPEAPLPPNTHLEVGEHSRSDDGTVLVWQAMVTVSVNNSTFE